MNEIDAINHNNSISFSSAIMNDCLNSPYKDNPNTNNNLNYNNSIAKYDDIYNQPNKMFSLGVLYEEKHKFTDNKKKQQVIDYIYVSNLYNLNYITKFIYLYKHV